MGDWRKKLGGRFLVERVQGKKWNVANAAREARIDAGTVRRIEQGENYEVVKLEKYAEALGRPLEAWLREVLGVPDDLMQRLTVWSDEQQPSHAGEDGEPTKKRRHAV